MREDAGLTIKEVSRTLGCSESKISRIENGKTRASPDDIRELLSIYGAGREKSEDLIRALREESQKKWWEAYQDVFDSPYVTYEAMAASINSFGGLAIPGLLQTEDYARAVLLAVRPDQSPEETARRVEFRMLRQTVLASDDPPLFSAVLDEAALRRLVGGSEIMLKQLQRLAEFSRRPSVTLQVLRFAEGEHAGMSGHFTVLHFAEEGDADLVFFDTPIQDVAYSDDPRVAGDYRAAFKELQRISLDPDESARFLDSMVEEL